MKVQHQKARKTWSFIGTQTYWFSQYFQVEQKKSTLDGTVMFSPLALEPHTFLAQFEATWASADEYTWSHTDKHTHTHQLPQMVSRLVEHQDSPPVRNDFGTTIKLHKQNSPEEVTFWTLQYIPLSNIFLHHPNMLVLSQHGIITFILPAFAAAHCFGPAVLPRFCCYHVWPVGQPLEDLCRWRFWGAGRASQHGRNWLPSQKCFTVTFHFWGIRSCGIFDFILSLVYLCCEG